jgi:tRNA(Ile)-lysidine synthetase-like protein
VNPPAILPQIDVPPGRWAVAVSGGADSVALLRLLHANPALSLHIVHLDHQLRGQESTEDADFVAALAAKLDIPATIGRRDQIEPELNSLPNNPSARYRAIRLEFFRRVVEREKLNGVVLAHQADDQAETILLRLLRGSGPMGLVGMKSRVKIGGLLILRPLLGVRRDDLRKSLIQLGQDWREDASNTSAKYTRNRIRAFLQSRPELHEPILAAGRACAEYAQWIKANAPKLKNEFPAIVLGEMPRMLARESARAWLRRQGVAAKELNDKVADRLRQMAADAATPARQLFPGKVAIHRRRGWIARA